MGVQAIIQLFVGFLGQYIFKPKGAAKYAKWFITSRDYLLLLFPLESFPVGSGDAHTATIDKNTAAVSVADVKAAQQTHGFNLSSLFGG